MATEFTIGARVSCSDGACGEVSRLITDPVALTVTHLVVRPRHKKHHGRLVPLDLVESAAGEITLRCTLQEYDQLEPAEEVDLLEGDQYLSGYDPTFSVEGFGDVGTPGNRIPTTINDVVPIGETQVRHGDHVHATDGDIGQVQGFVADPGTGQVTHVLLREGHLWGQKDIAIPVTAVVGIDDGVRLNLTKKQVEELPPAQ
jgi:PRC-barrel domain